MELDVTVLQSQAVEDGVTIAITLRLAGKNNIKLASQVHEKIRYPRVRSKRDLFERSYWFEVAHRLPSKQGHSEEEKSIEIPFTRPT